ncbi:hypothetical protein NA57DRAFT_50221 [Rhizodiscina lignyota]|uniref:Uncharacterized protein n=1 Tax=Rhizodiscina lignyota TaxID=1504668 RepID=A0A9P4M2N3_9PEZI|nr:hypothetical protein NA57DRAFT_50221 [Rhizodiscina lignyota]
MNSTTLNTTVQHGGTRGWVPQSNDRGTLDILTSCAITTFLCIWTCACVNVPAPGKGSRDIIQDRWHMFCLGILGPEFVLMSAIGQYCCAKTATQKFRTVKKSQPTDDWTMRHSYFADMGGVHVKFDGCNAFPVNAEQLHYLVAKEYLQYPSHLTLDVIKDKNKRDGLSRLLYRIISSVQMFWFTLNTIARPTQRLAVTTLELTTLGYIFCALGTLCFWRNKPMDILYPVTLQCESELKKIVSEFPGASLEEYHLTPLECISRKEWIGSQLWVYYVNILRRMRVVIIRPRVKPVLTRPMVFLMLLLSFSYTGIFVAGWNLYYPSNVERLLWRISTLGTLVVVVIGAIFEASYMFLRPNQISEEVDVPRDIEQTKQPGAPARPSKEKKLSTLKRLLSKTRNNSPDQDPALEIPLHALLFTTPLCALYTIFRIYILIEDIISLRRLPVSAFVSVDWSMYIPHINI